MDVSSPIRAVVPTLEAHVLTVLAQTSRPLTGRQVHRLAGQGSESGVRAVLSRLAHQGVVRTDRAGRAILYTGNREHLTWSAIRSLTSIRRTLVERLKEEIDAWVQQPLNAALFGSAARGDGDDDSDIDLLIVSPHGTELTAWERQIDSLSERVALWTGNHCQIYEIDLSELRVHVASAEPIVSEWKSDAIHLGGAQISALISNGEATSGSA